MSVQRDRDGGRGISRGEAIRRMAGLGLAVVGGPELLIATLTPTRTAHAEPTQSHYEGIIGVPARVDAPARTQVMDIAHASGFIRENHGNAWATAIPDDIIQVEDGAVVNMAEIKEGQSVRIGNPDKSNNARINEVTVLVPAHAMFFSTRGFGEQEAVECGIKSVAEKKEREEVKSWWRNPKICVPGCPPIDNPYTVKFRGVPSGDTQFQWWSLLSGDGEGRVRRSQTKQYEGSAAKENDFASFQYVDITTREILMLDARLREGTLVFNRTNAPTA